MTSRVKDNEIALIRCAIWDDFTASSCINPSLWLQKGFAKTENKNKTNDSTPGDSLAKTEHLKEIAKLPASDEYIHAFDRWLGLTQDETRFQRFAMTLENRMVIGLTGNGALETGCSLSRNYGMPYIPGSSIKGVVRAFAHHCLKKHASEICELLGSDAPDALNPKSGLVTFHDAWWIPQKNTNPFVLDIVTTHHQKYYNGESEKPSDKDSPIPNHLLAVQGSFLFVLEGESEYVVRCQTMLTHALQCNGIGAKTAAGYGYMKSEANSLSMWAIQNAVESRLSPEQKAALSIQAKRRAELAEQMKSPTQIIMDLQRDYKKCRDNADYRKRVESWIDQALEEWSKDKRNELASCLKNEGYIPGKKKTNYLSRKERLQKLRGE